MFEGWWESLGTALQVFYAIAIATSALLTIQLVLLVLGFDGDTDVDVDAHHDVGTGILSVRTVTAFFTGFGWAGVAALEAGWGLTPSIAAATFAGGAFMAGVLLLMRGLYSLRYSGTLDYHNAIGNVGSVYLRVPGAMAGPGQVEVMVQGRLRVVEAFTNAPADLPNRSRIKVVDVMGEGTLVVEPVGSPAAPATPQEE